MKIIITHDVDHIRVFEHKNDLIIPKFLARTLIELFSGYISFLEINKRIEDFVHNKWQNIEELMKFDKENGVRSTFFISVSRGRGLSYSLFDAYIWVRKIIQSGFNAGVHGIAYMDYLNIKLERQLFRKLSGLDKFGIRIHYLKINKKTLRLLDNVGYLYDSSLYKMQDPYKIGSLWEFPLSLMDGSLIYNNLRWQSQHLIKIKDSTKKYLEKAIKKNMKYFTILFHDRYFSDSFKTWKQWYIWLIEYLKTCKFEFTTIEEAIHDMDGVLRAS